MNFHTEHHMYAAVPCYNLTKLHALIKHDMPPCPRGLYQTWKQINEILQRQKVDAGYQYVAPLPARSHPADSPDADALLGVMAHATPKS
jgi:fatty acid desaturase